MSWQEFMSWSSKDELYHKQLNVMSPREPYQGIPKNVDLFWWVTLVTFLTSSKWLKPTEAWHVTIFPRSMHRLPASLPKHLTFEIHLMRAEQAIKDWNATHWHELLRCQTILLLIAEFLFLIPLPAHQETIFILSLASNSAMWKMARKPFFIPIHILMFAAIKLFIFRIETQLFVSIFVTPERVP